MVTLFLSSPRVTQPLNQQQSSLFTKGFFFFLERGDSEGKKEQIFMVNTKHAASGHGESEINRLFFFFGGGIFM